MDIKLPASIMESEVKAICKRYKISPQDARNILMDHFGAHPDLLKRIDSYFEDEDVTRWMEYKKVIKAVKKKIYYKLRRYHQDEEKDDLLVKELEHEIIHSSRPEKIRDICDSLLRVHVSTKERHPYYHDFYEGLFEIIDRPKKIIDLGCGIHPLSYPFDKTNRQAVTYLAIDKDRISMNILNIYSKYDSRIIPMFANIMDLDWRNCIGVEKFDFAFMLKLIPVVQRQDKELLKRLASVPADSILITGSIQSMTRKENIARKEDRILREFIELSKKRIINKFNIENEFGYLIS